MGTLTAHCQTTVLQYKGRFLKRHESELYERLIVGKTFRRATPSSVFSDHWLRIVAVLLWLVGGETAYKGGHVCMFEYEYQARRWELYARVCVQV